jgi:hypothetical protein
LNRPVWGDKRISVSAQYWLEINRFFILGNPNRKGASP